MGIGWMNIIGYKAVLGATLWLWSKIIQNQRRPDCEGDYPHCGLFSVWLLVVVHNVFCLTLAAPFPEESTHPKCSLLGSTQPASSKNETILW